MREFTCSSLGHQCAWKHVARTEELLTDVVAIHLRDVHGVRELDADMIGRIKGSFSNPGPAIGRDEPLPVLKEFRCSDLGMACNWHYIAQTEDLIVDGVAVHAREAHDIREFSQELKAKVEQNLRVWNG